MSQPGSPRDPQLNGSNHHAPRQAAAPETHDTASALHDWGDEALRQEIERLAAGNRELRASVGRDRRGADSGEREEVERLRGENAELRQRVAELEHALLERPESEEDWAGRQREYETLLEEKSEVIRSLHLKNQELREAASASAAVRGDAADSAQHQDVASLKQQLEDQRAQLEDDEQALEQQMRQMEMAMSRERAQLARQRSELQRLHNDLKHEMELAARDNALRERLQPLQRRQQEVANGRRVPSLVEINIPATPEPPKAAPEPTPAKKPGGSGLLRRLFRPKGE